MADVDAWLAKIVERHVDPATFDAIDRRIAAEATPQTFARRREARHAMWCAGIAAVLGFTVTGSSAIALAKPRPTWVASPSAESPYSLLVGR